MRWLILCLLCLVVTAPAALAEEDAVFVDTSKINTNDPPTLEPGQVEIQPAYLFFTSSGNYDDTGALQPGGDFFQDTAGVQVTVGVVDDFDVNLFLGRTGGTDAIDRTAGLNDVILGTRWRFYDEQASGLSMAYLTYLTVPAAPQAPVALSQGFTSLQHRLAVSKITGRWNLIADLGCTHKLGANSLGAEGGLSANLAAGYQIDDGVQPLIELNYGSLHFEGGPPSESLAITGGVMFYPAENLRLNFGVSQTVAGRNSPYGLTGLFFVTFSP
ncbi:MAG: transporter [Candidatus Eremiobacterota bacterium]